MDFDGRSVVLSSQREQQALTAAQSFPADVKVLLKGCSQYDRMRRMSISENSAADLCTRVRSNEAGPAVVGLDTEGEASAVEPAEPQALDVNDAADLTAVGGATLASAR
jgi:hypothetical protein